jgi:CTP synthase (UTP-ammonia lyase)
MRSMTPRLPRIALVGDRSSTIKAHTRIPAILRSTQLGTGPVEPYWIGTDTIEGLSDLAGFDGIWLTPGSPYIAIDGALKAVETARTLSIPFLGTCGGFQHLLLEIARDVCGLGQAHHAEVDPDAELLVIAPLSCSLADAEDTITIVAGTKAAAAMGAGPATERFFCRYGLNPAFADTLVSAGVRFSGHDANGDPRVVEVTDHPWMVGALFQPELSSDATLVHPLIRAFVDAAATRATVTQTAGAVR